MDSVRTYLLSVTAVSILCGIFSTITERKTAVSSILKLLMGVILALTTIKPFVNLKISQIQWYIDELSSDVNSAVSYGTEMSVIAMEEIIKAETEAYILDKVSALGLDLEINVTLDELIPVQVQLSGPISPNLKMNLSTWITDNLGISKEAQYWDI
jgi:hypothetical protein